MRILMVSPFPPLRDGIAKYAAQEVSSLRSKGHEVEVLSPLPCAAHHVEELKGALRFTKLRRYRRRYEKVILQYQPSHYHKKGRGLSRVLTNLGMWLTFRSMENLEIVCHEEEYPRRGGKMRPEFFVQSLAWRSAARVTFHTEKEKEEFIRRIGKPKATTIRAHGEDFTAASSDSRAEARTRLGLDLEKTILLCIGFLQPHKGFDTAIRAFRAAQPGGADLYVVGSPRVASNEVVGYVRRLRALAAGDPRVHLDERALSDAEFDRWIIASDYVVLPYREIFSSGVLERAKLLERPAILTNVGGLSEQARPDDILIDSEEELVQVFRSLSTQDVAEQKESDQIGYREAMAIVKEQAMRRKLEASSGLDLTVTSGLGIDRALDQLARTEGVDMRVVPSSRRWFGPLLTFLKRAFRKTLGWYVEPVAAGVNRSKDAATVAVAALASEVELLRESVEALERKLNGPP